MSQTGALMRLGRAVEAEQSAERLSREFVADPCQGPRGANMVGVGLLMKAGAMAAQERRREAERLANELIEPRPAHVAPNSGGSTVTWVRPSPR